MTTVAQLPLHIPHTPRLRTSPRRLAVCSAALIVFLVAARSGLAEIVAYTDETAFLNALTAQGFVPLHEGFEDDVAWGTVRSTIPDGQHTAPSITNLGITWSSSSPNNGITTGPGPALTGQWGFFSLPHGDYENGITDGWHGSAAQPLVAIGGWVDTNTPFAALIVFLDGNEQAPIDFNGDNVLGGPYRFFGIIEPAGFTTFDFRETEGALDDQKLIFSDDFTFAFSGVLQDCNDNQVADALDINNSTSADCNNNVVPDECEIDSGSAAPGGPFYCTESCAADCNINGLLDECEVVEPLVFASTELSPIGFEVPQSFGIGEPGTTQADAILGFTAYANLGGAPDHIDVDLNGTAIGAVFGPDGSDCPETGPDATTLVVPAETFNAAVGAAAALITMTASEEVSPDECDLPTYITVEVTMFVSSAADLDQDGVPDECAACPADLDHDATVGPADLALLLGAWGACPDPGNCPADLDSEGSVGPGDLALLLGSWGDGPCGA